MKLKKIKIRCNNCGTKIEINNNQCEYTTNSEKRSLGNEIHHNWLYRSICDYCNHNIWFEYNAFEYPDSIITWCEKNIHNAIFIDEPIIENE